MKNDLNSPTNSHALPPAPRIAIIGSVGVPNRYGGPEAFAESIAPALANRGFEVCVTCDKSRYLDDLSPHFRGVRRIFIPVNANGAASLVHDLLAFLSVVWRSKYVLALGVSGGLFFPLFRVLCALTGARLLVNIDGVEWRRSKFGGLARFVLFVSDWLAQRCAHVVIYDNDALLDYVRHRSKSTCVEYSGDHAVLAGRAVDNRAAADAPFALTICRIEPENNCELLIEGFLKSRMSSYVFVGNWRRSQYGRDLLMRYAAEPRLRLLDPIYDADELFRLRSSCTAYLHGHSVGGTNPSLVEILFFDSDILCWDCAFNRATADAGARYFSSAEDLAEKLSTPLLEPMRARAALRRRYSTAEIVNRLENALHLAGPSGRAAF